MRHGTLWWNGFAGHLLQCRMECTQPMIQRENLWKKIHPFSLKKELLWPMASKELPGWFKEIMNGSAMPSSCRIELVWTHAGNAQQRKTLYQQKCGTRPLKRGNKAGKKSPMKKPWKRHPVATGSSQGWFLAWAPKWREGTAFTSFSPKAFWDTYLDLSSIILCGMMG